MPQLIIGADILDVVQRILSFVSGERSRSTLRVVSRTWRDAYQIVNAGPRILVLVEWKIHVCDEMATPMHAVEVAPPQVERLLYDRFIGYKRAVEPAYALKKIVTAGDLAFIGYKQGWVQAIDMVSREQLWLDRASWIAAEVSDEYIGFFAGLTCMDTSPHGGQGGRIAVGFQSSTNGRIDLRHAATGHLIRSIEHVPLPEGVHNCSFSGDGAMIVAAGGWLGDTPAAQTTGVVVLCTATAAVLHRIPARCFISVVNCVAFVGSDCLITGSNDRCFKFWKLTASRDKPMLQQAIRHEDWVTACAASPDGSRVVSCNLSTVNRGRDASLVTVYDVEMDGTDTAAGTSSSSSDRPDTIGVTLHHRGQYQTRTRTPRCTASFCEGSILIGECSRFESHTRRVTVWADGIAESTSGGAPSSSSGEGAQQDGSSCQPRITSRSFGKGEFAAPVAWLPSAAFRDYPRDCLARRLPYGPLINPVHPP